MMPQFDSILSIVHESMRPPELKSNNNNNNNNKRRMKTNLSNTTSSQTRTKGTYSPILIAATATAALLLLDLVQANGAKVGEQANSKPATIQEYLDKLSQEDKCGAIYTSKFHGYDVIDYKVPTKDKYELHAHRLVHPEDYLAAATSGSGAKKPMRKPYLLVHGLIGTSASFVTNIDESYAAPPATFKWWHLVDDLLAANAGLNQFEYESTAHNLKQTSHHEPAQRFPPKSRRFADSLELQFDGEHMRFEREFRQSYKKFVLPKQSLGYVTNSLAFTLANLGYDVWMINLRGNEYSRFYNGPLNAERAEYWDFKIETIIKEDLAATIKFIQAQAGLHETNPIGLVTYSYSSIFAMGLLTKFPKYRQQLRPVIMLAPTLLTGTRQRGKFKYLMKLINFLISKNGPIPALGRARANDSVTKKLIKVVCSLPVGSKLCRLLESIIMGRARQTLTVKGMLTTDRETELMLRDVDCGQTSRAIVHEIVDNLSQHSIDPNFKPFAPAGQSSMLVPGKKVPERASVMLVHSDSDQISTSDEVAHIRDTALKTMTLVDYVIREPRFGHTDFLFSQSNQYLVNAEVARMAIVHDYLTTKWDAKPAPAPATPAAPANAYTQRVPLASAAAPPTAQFRQAAGNGQHWPPAPGTTSAVSVASATGQHNARM